MCRGYRDIRIIIAVWKGIGVFEKNTGTQSWDRVSQPGVREGSAEVTIFAFKPRKTNRNPVDGEGRNELNGQ